MTLRVWNGATADISSSADWTPNGAPQPGDVLVIQSGNPIVDTSNLDGYIVLLGGTNAGTGPGYYAILPQQGGIVPAPNPTLTVGGNTLGPNTIVSVPGGQLRLFPLGAGAADQATLFFPGTTGTNDGTIVAQGGLFPFQPGGWLTISVQNELANGQFTNNGTIIAGQNATIDFFGVATQNGTPYVDLGSFTNDGTIVDNGTIVLGPGHYSGTGQIELDATGGLFSSVRPALLELDEQLTSFMGPGQTIDFHGGHLQLDTETGQANFHATLANFGADPTDEITLTNFVPTLTSHAFSNGTLDLNFMIGQAPETTSLTFAGNYTAANFAVAQTGQDVVITYQPALHLIL